MVLRQCACSEKTLSGSLVGANVHEAPSRTQARICKFDVLQVVDGRIVEITSFGRALADQFGFPEHL